VVTLTIIEEELIEMIQKINKEIKKGKPFEYVLNQVAIETKHTPRTLQKYFNDFSYKYNRGTKQYEKTRFKLNDRSIHIFLEFINNTNEYEKEKATMKHFEISEEEFDKILAEYKIKKNSFGKYCKEHEQKMQINGKKYKEKTLQNRCCVCTKKTNDEMFCSEKCHIEYYKKNKNDNILFFSEQHEKIYNYIRKKTDGKKGKLTPIPHIEEYKIIDELSAMGLIEIEYFEEGFIKKKNSLIIKMRW
jgi:hypothetical protein